MEYLHTRSQLVVIFVSRFVVCDSNTRTLEALWGPFLDAVMDLGLIDEETRDHWIDAGCPRAPMLSALAGLHGDAPHEDVVPMEPEDGDDW